MGRSLAGSDAWGGDSPQAPSELPEHPVTVNGFRLDRYEVTVARMRNFVQAYDAWRAAGHPAEGEGAHPEIPGSGWSTSWNLLSASGGVYVGAKAVPESAADAVATMTTKCSRGSANASYSAVAGARDNLPVNCVNWYLAYAFCAWDGGYLPTEAQWEYAAAGGEENRLYPWGPQSPAGRARYGGDSSASSVEEMFGPVGSYSTGGGRWGQLDLAGSLDEWNLDTFAADWYSSGGAACADCANLGEWVTGGVVRSWRGGDWASSEASGYLRSAARSGAPDNWYDGITDIEAGFRCARPSRQ